jgi:hypothetical protein
MDGDLRLLGGDVRVRRHLLGGYLGLLGCDLRLRGGVVLSKSGSSREKRKQRQKNQSRLHCVFHRAPRAFDLDLSSGLNRIGRERSRFCSRQLWCSAGGFRKDESCGLLRSFVATSFREFRFSSGESGTAAG